MFKSHVCIYSGGLDDAAIKQKFRDFDIIDLRTDSDYKFIPGDRYLVFDKDAYDVIVKHQRIHLGPRREGFYDVTHMKSLKIRNGVIFKFSYIRHERKVIWLDNKVRYDSMVANSESISKKFRNVKFRYGLSKKNGKPWYMMEYDDIADQGGDIDRFLIDPKYVPESPKVKYSKIIRSKEDLIKSFDYFINQDKGRRFGFDYETCHGFPFDNEFFEPMGLGIADLDGIAAYFDIEYYKYQSDYYDIFLSKLKEFCDKHGSEVYTYNVSFELRVTYLLVHEMYPFNDSATINKLMGDVQYNMSLKYTAMRYCSVASWDKLCSVMQ